MVKQVHYVKEGGKGTSMFFACDSATTVKNEHVWYIDNGYNNHMTLHESMLIDEDKNVTT